LAVDPRFRTLQDRYAHREDLAEALAAVTTRFTTAECVDRLDAARVPVAPVNTVPEVSEHPQFAAVRDAGGIVEMPVGALGDVRLVMSPIHLSATPISARRPPPQLGQDTDDLLASIGLDEAEIASLRQGDVVR
jgi:crotonobetainyl-CoA:carnitine CoA-transferase CaiB-like acyl-CoA transferase